MFKGKVILVVDDEPDLREILKDEFVYEGAEVFEAANGQEALKIIESHQFDAILSDLRMPGGDGASLTRELRKKNSSQPAVVLITGFADLEIEDAFEMGADAYLTKPFQLGELKRTVARLLSADEKRWMDVRAAEMISHQLSLSQPLDQILKDKILVLGRGGVFLSGTPSSWRVGDVFRLGVVNLSPVILKVSWARIDSGDGLRAGVGAEFVILPEDVRTEFDRLQPGWRNLISIVPKN